MIGGATDDEVAGLADRIAGTLVASAVGDALGAGYEFGSAPLPADGRAAMIGGGLGDFAPGEWTDDTAMGIAVAEVTARHGATDLHAIGERFLDWFHSGPPDVGNATRAVLSRAADPGQLVTVAADHLERHPRGGAGNGALMRTGAVALAYLGDDVLVASAARDVAKLTHADPLAADSCVLWCIAIDRAIREQRLDGVHDGLDHVTPANRAMWADALAAAEDGPPGRFTPNGFTVTALQAAYSAIRTTPVPAHEPAAHLVEALHAAIRIGDDTDTVAAIAGMLLGARWGAGAVPGAWRRLVHGWPGADAVELARLALRTASHGFGRAIGGVDDPDDAHFAQAVTAIRATVGAVTIELTVGDITAQPDLDAIVNAANAELTTGGGVAGAIHAAAGPGLADEAVPLGPIRPGQCVRTDGHDLVNAHVLHCLGPVHGRDEPAAALLADCYRHTLRVAEEYGITSVGFPAISTGAFGFPLGPAAEVALTTVTDLAPTLGSVTLIRFVLFDDEAMLAHRNALAAALAE